MLIVSVGLACEAALALDGARIEPQGRDAGDPGVKAQAKTRFAAGERGGYAGERGVAYDALSLDGPKGAGRQGWQWSRLD